MIGEFRAFLLKTNALALAIGVIIGAALGNVVGSLVNDIIMPPIGVVLGGVDFSSLVIKLKDATVDAAGKPVPEVDIRYGTFINFDHHVRRDRLRRLHDRPLVHQGTAGGRGQDLPLLQGTQLARRVQVQGLHQRHLNRAARRRRGSRKGRHGVSRPAAARSRSSRPLCLASRPSVTIRPGSGRRCRARNGRSTVAFCTMIVRFRRRGAHRSSRSRSGVLLARTHADAAWSSGP